MSARKKVEHLNRVNHRYYDLEPYASRLPLNTTFECKAGLGLRPQHYPYLEDHPPKESKWFEVVSENYMDSWGRPREFLNFMRRDFPIALHGVGMSLASPEGLNQKYLNSLRFLVEEIDPFIVSDHLCWTGDYQHNTHDLLPFPFTEESLKVIINNIDRAQNFLQREILVENVSSYMTFESSHMSEKEFLLEILQRSGAKLLLDLNNIYVNSKNHGFNAEDVVASLPMESVGQIHLAGFTDCGDYLFDTHSQNVWPEVWKLFRQVISRKPDLPFMIEWDENIPSYPKLEEELKKAKDLWSIASCHAL